MERPASPEAAARAAAPLPGATRAPTPAIEVLAAVFLGERGRAVLQVRRWHVAFDDAGEIAASGFVVEPFLLALPPTAAQCDAALAWRRSHRDVEDAAVVLHVDGHPVRMIAMGADSLDALVQEARRQIAASPGAETGAAGGASTAGEARGDGGARDNQQHTAGESGTDASDEDTAPDDFAEPLAHARAGVEWFIFPLNTPTFDALCLPEFQDALDLLEERGGTDHGLVMNVRARCIKEKLTAKAFDDARKNHRTQKARKAAAEAVQGRSQPLQPVGQQLPTVPIQHATLLVPRGYRLAPDATRAGWGEEERIIAHAPVLIVGKQRDAEAGVEYFKLAWCDAGRWRYTSTDRGVALDAYKLTALASAGFPVNSSTASQMVNYLQAFESANPALPIERVSSHLGWQGKDGGDGFLWGRTHIAPAGAECITFRGLTDGDEEIADALTAAGTRDDWRAAVCQLGPYPRVALALYVALAPMLLKILQRPSFLVDWWNKTTTGKTTTERVGASTCGQPDETQTPSVVMTWDETKVKVERTAAIVRDLPLCLDETKRARNPQLVSETIYMIAHGRGRGRGNVVSTERTRTWRTVGMSTGESPATSFTQDGGTRMRCLEVRGMPFEKQDAATGAFVDRLNTAVCENYGHAGPAFVRYLLDHRADWPAWLEEYKETREHYGATGSGRLAGHYAVIHLAARLVHELFSLPWDFRQALDGLWPDIAAEGQDAAGSERALTYVLGVAQAHKAKFKDTLEAKAWTEKGSLAPPVGWYGRWGADKDTFALAFYEHVLDRTLRDGGFEPDAIKAAWRDGGVLDVDKDRKRYTKKIGPRQDRERMVCIRRDALLRMELVEANEAAGAAA